MTPSLALARAPPRRVIARDASSLARHARQPTTHRAPALREQADSDAVDVLRVWYYRADGAYDLWGAHVWGDAARPTAWDAPAPGTPASAGEWTTYAVELAEGAKRLSVLIHRGEEQDCRAEDLDVTIGTARDVWLVSGYSGAFEAEPDLTALPKGDIDKQRAIWVASDIIAIPPDFASGDIENVAFALLSSPEASLSVTGEGVIGGEDEPVPLDILPSGLPESVRQKFPHVAAAGYRALAVRSGANVRELLRRQLAVAAVDANGSPADATGVQLQGALDDLYSYDGPLGAEFGHNNVVTLRVWAPTAKNVSLTLFDTPRGDDTRDERRMTLDEVTGVWSVSGDDFDGKYYNYNVTVFNPTTGKVSTNVASDPYARSLAADGRRAHVCDVSKSELKPKGWDALLKPAFTHPVDSSIYELHIRDFSAMDETVSQGARGKYIAFGEKSSVCVSHLMRLAESGLSHVHLLPSYDFGSVPELAENQKSIDVSVLKALPSNSPKQQELIDTIDWPDAFNWGYDPVHYGVPEGSYATNPDGPQRVLEYRTMVKSLAEYGLRVICDVVYNHTLSSGPSDVNSVLDKIVPGYYHRRNFDGIIEASTCCNNTASEHFMMDRLIVDDLVHWAKTYKVDGFRFDLMGHLMLSTMLRAKKVLGALTMEKDGVDGKSLYLYGEGWDYAEVCQGRVGKNASQLNLAHTGIGSFNDRVREGCIGGSPFADPRLQGFLTGLYYTPNGAVQQGDRDSQRYRMMEDGERIIAALAGNVRDFAFVDRHGIEVMASSASYPQSNVAYAGEPEETVNYVSAHDNETLFDCITLRAAKSVSLAERCRVSHLATAIVALAQGVPFFHAGDEILRNYSGETHNFGIGLPPARKNGDRYGFIAPMLADLSMRPSKEQIQAAIKNFCELLSIRRSTPLLRLRSTREIQRRIKFYNRGPAQVPGLIIASINDGDASTPGLATLDTNYKRIVLAFNATPQPISHHEAGLKVDFAGIDIELHPLVSDLTSLESVFVDGVPTIPPYTWVVFVQRR